MAAEIDLRNVEYSLLLQEADTKDDSSPYFQLVKDICYGNFEAALKTDFAKVLLASGDGDRITDLKELISKNVETHLIPSDEEKGKRELEALLVAVSCLQLFVQNNWLGPSPSALTPKHVLPEYLCNDEQSKQLRDSVEAGLSVDGEPVYPLTQFPEFLLVAVVILIECREKFPHLQTVDWWAMRCINVQQQVLDKKSNTLRETVLQLIQKSETKEPLMTDEKYRDLQIQFHLEAGYLCHMYYGYREAKAHYNTAKKIAALDIQFTGVMGKRTRYQETNKAQLVLQVTRQGDGGDNQKELVVTPSSELPKNLNLDDDTVLDQINFEDGDIPPTQLSSTEQALVLGLMEDHRRGRAAEDTLVEEELQAYYTYVLSQVRSWCVSMSALLLRSKLEKTSSRRIDRSMRQIEELYNQTRREIPPVGERMGLFYSVSLCPSWDIQRQLAEMLISLGAIGSALQIYERLQMWEEAIACYQRMGKVEKAETVIREQLEVKATPNLWCFLGDVTGSIEHYEKAWELSKHRSARAQRCMGYLYFRKENYEKCLECFKKSLEVNSLQVPVWFTYGCAAMAAKDYPLAIRAFKRCVAIDYDNFEAWNNLASSFVKIGEKKMAYMSLNDALKCNFQNWRIWDNYMVVSTDVGEFASALRAYNMLLDLKEKWVDQEVLGVLVRAVMEKIPAADGRTADLLEPELRKLFGRITAKVTDKAEIWRLYAKLCSSDLDKSLPFLQKAHRCVTQTSNWEKDVKQCQEIAQQSLNLADTYCQCSCQAQNPTQSIQMLSSAKLMLRGVLTKIKQQHTDPITQEVPSELIRELCASLEEKMNTIIEKANELKGR